jgi:uncharacterized membrane protein HdeD (DUF308 family)
LSLSRKLLRLLSLVCGIVLIVVSPFLIFHPEKVYYPDYVRGIGPPDYFWGYSIYNILFGVFLLMAGIVLIVASYYHHDETDMAVKNESITI